MSKTTRKDIHLTRDPNPVFSFAVHDIAGRKIVKKGEQLTPQLLSEIRRTTPKPKPFIAVCKDVALWKDIHEAIHHPPYKELFRELQKEEELMGIMGETKLSPFVIQVLSYFKELDTYTYWHSLHVFVLTAYMSLQMLSWPQGKNLISVLGPLHDVGKIEVPIEVLRKETPITRDEGRCLRHHALAGAVLLSYYEGSENLSGSLVALDHHERRDGSGYPRGVPPSGFIVEIVALCDIYDALVSPRPYRNRPFDTRTALEVITKMVLEGKFSPEILQFLISLHRSDKPDYREVKFSTTFRGVPPEKNLYGTILEDLNS